MLTDSEKVAVCFVLNVANLPTKYYHKAFKFILQDEQLTEEQVCHMTTLHAEIERILELKKDTIKELTTHRDDARHDYAELKKATEALIYKIKEPAVQNVSTADGHAMATVVKKEISETYEFKEVKAILNIY